MIKFVATDIDGTILGKTQKFTPGLVACIEELKKHDVKVVVVTGRMYAAARQIATRLKLDTPVVAYQGGMIVKDCHSDEILYNSCLEKKDVKAIINWARENNIHLNLYSNDILYVEKDNDTIRRYASLQNVNYNVCSFDELELDGINKLLAIDYTDEDRVTEWINERQASMPHLYIIKSSPWFCEFSTKEATKKCAVEFLRDYWGFKKEEVLTIGDQDNDIELLKAGGISIAMGNSTPELRKYADYITDTVDNDGFVGAIEEFVLKERS